jgi:hypothetical protein
MHNDNERPKLNSALGVAVFRDGCRLFIVPFQKWLKQNTGKTYGEVIGAKRNPRQL